MSDSARIDITISTAAKGGASDDVAVEEQDLGSWLHGVAQKYNKQPERPSVAQVVRFSWMMS